jgi:hypothetical protein
MRLALLAVLAIPAIAHADDSNFRPYVIGARAAGMGGAFTALADDGSGPYYNPGGIAFALRSSLSLSASVYGYVSGTISDALGPGHDFHYQDLNTFPVSTSVVRKLGSSDTVAGSVFVPDAFRIDDRDNVQLAQNAFFLSDELQTVWVGASYAHRAGRLGIGASVFGLLGTETQYIDITAAKDSMNYATLTGRTDTSTNGLVGALGARYDATDQWHLGLSAYSPELGYGNRRTFQRATIGQSGPMGGEQIVEVNEDHLHASPSLPMRVQAGAAFTGEGWAIAADAIFLGPRSVHDDADRAADGLDRRIVRNAVVDGALGGEVVIANAFPVRVGMFTDFAQSPVPVSHVPGMPDPNPANTSHVDRFGGSMSLGYHTDHTATDVGATMSYGVGKDEAPQNLDFSNLQPTKSTQLDIYVFIASSYEF